MSKEQLEQNIAAARSALNVAEAALATFIASPEQNVFASVDEASSILEGRLSSQARADCEGAYNCGSDEYTQEFIVDGVHWIASYKPEYNRHDKTYYYIDGSDFTVALK